MSRLSVYEVTTWTPHLTDEDRRRARADLEAGKVLYFPHLAFPFRAGEEALFGSDWGTNAKNVSYRPDTGTLKGLKAPPALREQVSDVMKRYAELTRSLTAALFPDYGRRLRQARTSFRAVEVGGRPSSVRKNDTLLHVDAFPSSPTGGERILRVFCNVNPVGQTRNWRLGEPFEPYAERFASRVKLPLPGAHALLKRLGITKSRRSLYDHYMLTLHDLGKIDRDWQARSPQERFDFPAGSTWLCFTDEVLHAALSGRYLLEQTFHLPVDAMHDPRRSPLRVLERITRRLLADRA